MIIRILSICLLAAVPLRGMQKARTLGDFTDRELALFRAADSGDVNGLKGALEKGLDINICNQKKQTALFLSTRKGHTAAVKFLAENGSDVAFKDENDLTALHWASICGYIGCFNTLCNHGADMNAPDKDGFTPLHFAASCGQGTIIDSLVSRKAKIEEKNKKGETPLHLAAVGGFLNCVRKLLKAGAKPNAQTEEEVMTPFHYAARAGKHELIPILGQRGAYINGPMLWGKTAVHLAVSQETEEHIKTTEELIKLKVDLNAKDVTALKETPLHCAARLKHFRQIELLLAAGADSSMVNAQGLSVVTLLTEVILPEPMASTSLKERFEKALSIAQERHFERLEALFRLSIATMVKKRKNSPSEVLSGKVAKKAE